MLVCVHMNNCVVCGLDCNNKFCSISCRNKLYNSIVKPYLNTKPPERKTYELVCKRCNVTYTLVMTIKKFSNNNYTKFCSRSCANSRVHSENTKMKMKLAKKPEASSFNTCKFCGIEFKKINYKKFCSDTCKLDSRKEYYKTQFPNKNLLNSYRLKCKFVFSVYKYPETLDLTLIEKYGFYSPSNKKNNLGGVSLDHIYSIKDGFDNNVDPYYMSHIMNCRLIIHNENVSKGKNSLITLEELYKKVDLYDNKYKQNHIETLHE